MTAVQALHHLLDINIQRLSKKEILILEAELFTRICEELKEVIRKQNKDYFSLMKFTIEKENTMIESSFIRCIINDILSTEEYNIPGIAHYTDTPEDVIYEVASGCNRHPTLSLARKVIELHRSVRPNLYREIINKITDELPPET
jgi:hypothetical protein